MPDIISYFLFAVFGYLLGSVLFANVFASLFGKKDIYSSTGDKNPGTANAFKQGGFACGLLTLICDVGKGIIPVMLCLRYVSCENQLVSTLGTALVLLAPVLGHMFPVYSGFKGGKGIAVTFGVLIGLFPEAYPFICLCALFILFSAVIIIKSDFYKTLIVYLCACICYIIKSPVPGLRLGFVLITLFVFIRFHISKEKREKFEVKFLWTH